MDQRHRPLRFGLLAFAAIVVFHALDSMGGRELGEAWDDALFFKRFALHMADHGVAAWNVGERPVHGNTSQLFQLVALGVVAVTRDHYNAGVKVVLAAALWGTYLVLTRLLSREAAPDAPADAGPSAVALTGLCAPILVSMIASGMETLVALLVLSVGLGSLHGVERAGARLPLRAGAAFVAAQLLAYLARPDMILLGMVVAGIVLYDGAKRPWEQRRLLALSAAVGLGLAALLAVFHVYYGTAFPLSFYLKSRLLSPYDTRYLGLDLAEKRLYLWTWLFFVAPFGLLALWRRDRWNLALLAGAAVFVAYHALSTVEIMGYHSRFYLPAFVAVVLAGARAWPAFVREHALWKALPPALLYPAALAVAFHARWIESSGAGYPLGWLDGGLVAAHAAAVAVLLLSPLWKSRLRHTTGVLVPSLLLGVTVVLRFPDRIEVLDDAAISRNLVDRYRSNVGIYEVEACVPEPFTLYHSELGIPGVLFPGSRIVDLTGLMNPRLVFGAPSFDAYCQEDRPEVIFLPHWTHERLNREIQESRCIQGYVKEALPRESSCPLYLREDLHEAFEACRRARVTRSPPR
jgi:hypothetical protein